MAKRMIRCRLFSVSVPVYRADGVASGHYRRGLYDNYFSTVIEKNMVFVSTGDILK